MQASLFDVSNMAAPQRLAQLNFGAGATPVESEPHAFLYWAPANLAVMPVSNYDPEFEGAVGIRIGPATLSQVGHDRAPATRRARRTRRSSARS